MDIARWLDFGLGWNKIIGGAGPTTGVAAILEESTLLEHELVVEGYHEMAGLRSGWKESYRRCWSDNRSYCHSGGINTA